MFMGLGYIGLPTAIFAAKHGVDVVGVDINPKVVENSSRDVQIAFANELSLICDKAGINVWELISLANKHPRVNILQPGCGVGGHCIAVGPYFITADYPAESKIIAAARNINNYKSFWCAEKVKSTMLEFELKKGYKPVVAMMGLAFKPNIDDLRESPSKNIVGKVMQMWSYRTLDRSISSQHNAPRSTWQKQHITSFTQWTIDCLLYFHQLSPQHNRQ